MDDSSIYEYIKIINIKKPSIIIGYATALEMVSNYIIKNNVILKNNNLKGVFSTAEMLQPFMKNNIEKAFNVDVYNSYGSSEIQSIADTCDYGAMHVHDERVILRKDKIDGSLLVTDLDNFSLPYINYQINDKADIDYKKYVNVEEN